jgi:hypothetical protein
MEGDFFPCSSLASFARIKARIFVGKSSNLVMTGHHLVKRPPSVRTYIPESGINFGADRYVFSKSIALGVMMINQIEIVKVLRKRVPDAMRLRVRAKPPRRALPRRYPLACVGSW